MSNAWCFVSLIASLFWRLVGWVAGKAGNEPIQQWCQDRVLWNEHRLNSHDQNGPLYTWWWFRPKIAKYRAYGLKSPEDVVSRFNYLKRTWTVAEFAKSLGMPLEKAAELLAEMENDDILKIISEQRGRRTSVPTGELTYRIA